jgi:hypothetical protein
MTTAPDLEREPFRFLYVVMTEVLEEGVGAQERGDVAEAVRLAEDVRILGRAIEILGGRISLAAGTQR